MFVCSVKTSRRQLISLLLCVGVLVLILIAAFCWPARKAALPSSVTVTAADEGARIAYLQSLGYDADLSGGEVREVLIPEEFDEVFSAYNEMQKAADMDLFPYHGKRLKCWSYRILNAEGGETLAHLYTYKDKIVGGDISETVAGGRSTALVARR